MGREATGKRMQLRVVLLVVAHKVAHKGVARKDCRRQDATVPGQRSDRRLGVVPKAGLRFPFALAQTVPARRFPSLARHRVRHPVLGGVLAAAEAITGRVLAAMQNLVDDPEQTPDQSGAAQGRVRH